MKRLSVVAILAVMLLVGCQKADTAEATTEISPNGIEYVRLYMPDTEDVAIQIAWPSDWVMREDVNQAVPILGTELILAGGAEGFPPGEVIEVYADLHAEGTLWVTTDHLHGQLIAPKDNLDTAIEIAAAHLLSPTMDSGWFERIQQGAISNMTEALSVPANRGYEALRWIVLGDTPLRSALTADEPEMYSTATREQVLEWHRTTVIRDGARIVVAGAIDAHLAGKAVDRLLSQLPKGNPVPPRTPKADFASRRILLHVPEAQTSTLIFIGPLPPTRQGSEFEDVLLATALGGDDNSVLFDAVRTGLRASYGFGAGIEAYMRDLRFLFLAGEIETGKLGEAEGVVRTAYEEFTEKAVMSEVLARKSAFEGHAEQTAKDPVSASFSAMMALLDGQDPNLALTLPSVLSSVSEESLQTRVEAAFPSADALIVLAVSPDATALPGACVIRDPAEAVRCR